MGRIETHRNDYFHFHSFSAFRILFLHEKKLWWCFLIFWIFLLFFWNFLLQVEQEHIGTNFFFFFFLSFSTFPNLYWHGKRLWWCFLIIWIVLLFFWNFLFRVGMKPIGTIIFIFSLSQPFPSYFGLKRSYDGDFKFFEIFCHFFRIFYSGSGRNPSERLFLFSFYLSVSHPILAWKEAMTVFSNFLNFVTIFL